MYPYDNVKPCIKVCRKSSHEYATVAKSIVHSKKKKETDRQFSTFFACNQMLLQQNK